MKLTPAPKVKNKIAIPAAIVYNSVGGSAPKAEPNNEKPGKEYEYL